MLSNIAMIRGIYRNEFKCMYLKNQKNFVECLLYFWVYIKFWIFWKKKKKNWVLWLNYFRNYSLQKMCLLECIAGPASEHSSAVNALTGSKHFRTLQESAFILFFHNSDIDRATKCPY